MITILVLAALAGWGVVLRRRCRWAPEVIPLALAASVISVLLLAALAGSLRAGVWLLIAGGILGGLVEWRAAGWKMPRRVAGTPALVIFAIVSVVSAWWLRTAALWTFDEFAHWGLVAKVIISAGRLPAADSPVIFADYPPGSALFYYFFTFGREYSEPALYAAHAVLAFAAICALCIGSGWLAAAVAFVAGYFALFAFAGGLQALNADVLVALFFGAALGGYFRDDSKDRSWLIPVALALPLLKAVGLVLALLLTVVIACDQLIAGAASRRRIAWLLILIAVPLLMSGVWRLRMTVTNTPPTFALPMPGIAGAMALNSERGRVATARFPGALVSRPVNPPWADTPEEQTAQQRAGGRRTPVLTVAACTGLFTLFAALAAAAQPDPERRRRILVAVLVLLSCAALYGVGLLFLYVQSFTEYEGTRLASFGRYFGILFLGLVAILLAWLLDAWRIPGWRGRAAQIATVTLAAGLVYIAPAEARGLLTTGPRPLSPERRQIQQLLQQVASPENGRVYFVWQGTPGLEFHQSRYELAPRQTNKECWALDAADPRDFWTCKRTPAEWAAELQPFDTLMLGRADSTFWGSFGILFEGERNAQTFLIQKDASASPVRLMAAPEIAEQNARVARDRQRVADLAEIQKALEKYAARVGKLPTPESYGEAGGAAGFWDTWWDLSAVDGNSDGRPFLEFLVDQQIISRVPLDPRNQTSGSADPRAGQQYVYLVLPAGANYAGGPCRAADRWHYLLAITDLESERVRPPKGFATSQCSCLWRDKPNFFQEHFDYVLCGVF